MNLSFPSRFLKKLDIYQQIRNGQGISKHKNLWKYESAFLQFAYGENHQFLNESLNKKMIIYWIKEGICAEYNGDALDQIIGNLIWRGYLIEKDGNYKITKEGILVGEIASEINNKNYVLKKWNQYKYSLILDDIWLFILAGLTIILLPSEIIKNIQYYRFHLSGLEVSYVPTVLVVVFLLWPLLCWLYRKIYFAIEKENE